jgi:hypothetical protein
MTLQEAKTAIAEIRSRTDIGAGSKNAMIMRIRAKFVRENPNADTDELV